MIKHFSVMLNEVLESIQSDVKIIVDGTLGHGGHTREILDKFTNIQKIYGFDLDPNILQDTKKRLENYSDKIEFVGKSYTDISSVLGTQKVDFVLLDLGVNMEHFKDGSRGFSINFDSDLDMRFNDQDGISAYEIVNQYSIDQLINIFVKYADFTQEKSQEIARMIVKTRKNNPIQTTFQLKSLFNSVGVGQKSSIVLFQAIRIETNKEIDNLESILGQIESILESGGRCGIITFHSLEDRIVKNYFKELVKTGKFKFYNKKALKPHYKEVEQNRASRSAKYRVIEKI